MRTVLFVFSAVLWAQNASPQFEVATIKVALTPDGRGYSVSSRGGPGTQDPSLFTCHNWSASNLVSRAFDLPGYELSALDWMDSQRFDMSAKIPEGTTEAQFRLMLQNFLAERFKLTYHREKKEVPAYSLVVAKNGPKFKESVPVPPPEDSDRPSAKPSPMKRGEDGYPILPAGRDSTMAVMNGYASQRFGDETMEHLAGNLGFQLHAPVVDATGLKAKYDFALHWVTDRTPEDAGPNLFRAVQEQLGLKLESKKTPIDVLVVDHFEKTPTEN
jgi:uncharacterized protein (TIGR03435 family)